MAKGQTPEFDEMQKVDQDDDLDDEDVDWFDFEDPGDTVVGELREVKHDCGPNNSRVYKISRGIGDTTLFWGAGSLNQQFDQSELERGDVIGVRLTDETYENEHGEFPVYDVREP